jgi:hypothetical protein
VSGTATRSAQCPLQHLTAFQLGSVFAMVSSFNRKAISVLSGHLSRQKLLKMLWQLLFHFAVPITSLLFYVLGQVNKQSGKLRTQTDQAALATSDIDLTGVLSNCTVSPVETMQPSCIVP